MDLNELLGQHQIALIEARQRGGEPHEGSGLVRHYADRIVRLRRELGVCQYALLPGGLGPSD